MTVGPFYHAALATILGASITWLLTRRHYVRRQAYMDTSYLLHYLHPGLANASRSRESTQRRKSTVFVGPDGFSRVVRIVLTGGPCGGKSSSLADITRKATMAGYDVLIVPETATIMFNGNVQFPDSKDDQVNFQCQLMRLQLAAERAFTRVAERTGRPTIVVMDRGLMDGKGYVQSKDMWEAILHKHDLDEAYLLGRYDAVVHLVTSADGAERFYKSGKVVDGAGNTVYRRETAEEARDLDRKMQEVWAGHPEHHIITNHFDTFEDKMDAGTDAVMRVALKLQPPGSPQRQTHRTEEREPAARAHGDVSPHLDEDSPLLKPILAALDRHPSAKNGTHHEAETVDQAPGENGCRDGHTRTDAPHLQCGGAEPRVPEGYRAWAAMGPSR